MADELKTTNTALSDDNIELYNREIVSVPTPEKKIGVDTKEVFFDNIIQAYQTSQIDTGSLNSFTTISQSRDTMYSLLDSMCDDSTIAAVLERYAEDTTETNDEGRIVWCTSDDNRVMKFVTFLLDTMNVDKNIYKWVTSLIKYGDLYLRLYRKSDYKDDLFTKGEEYHFEDASDKKETPTEKDGTLNEDINLVLHSKADKFVHYVEMIPNPAEMFELTKFGKTYAYIQAEVRAQNTQQVDSLTSYSYYRYNFKKGDINIYPATEYVHAALEDDVSRQPEVVRIFLDSDNFDSANATAYTYTSRKGRSLFYPAFKIWRELMLLENSLLLNRLTRSSVIRIINVEIGDMPKENVQIHLAGIKNLIEQKSALYAGNGLNEYTNPGPIENTIYVPSHEGKGVITASTIGGEVDVKAIVDIEYFRDKLFGTLKCPKQFFGFTGDQAGFDGGTSLSIISSSYAKTVKRVQNTIIQALTDAINLMLLDKQMPTYVNNFQLHMVIPETREEIDRRENTANRIGLARDIMDIASDVTDPAARLKMLKALLKNILSNDEVLNILQEEINKLEPDTDETPAGMDMDNDLLDGGNDLSLPSDIGGENNNSDIDLGRPEPISPNIGETTPQTELGTEETETLPSPSDLGDIDFSDNSNF